MPWEQANATVSPATKAAGNDYGGTIKDNGYIAPSAPSNDAPPAPPNDDAQVASQPPAPPSQASPAPDASVPQPPSTISIPDPFANQGQPFEPEHHMAVLNVGQRLDFGEGKFTLDDVWVYSEAQPVLYTVRDLQGNILKKGQIIPPNEVPFTSKSGRKYWLYATDIAAPFDIYLKRARIYVLEQIPGEDSFKHGDYLSVLGAAQSSSKFPSYAIFGPEIIRAIVSKGGYLDAPYVRIKFEDLNRYPETSNPAILTFYDDYSNPTGVSTLPVGSAYVFSPAHGQKLAVYNAGTRHANETDNATASLRVYYAAGFAEAGATYAISD